MLHKRYILLGMSLKTTLHPSSSLLWNKDQYYLAAKVRLCELEREKKMPKLNRKNRSDGMLNRPQGKMDNVEVQMNW